MDIPRGGTPGTSSSTDICWWPQKQVVCILLESLLVKSNLTKFALKMTSLKWLTSFHFECEKFVEFWFNVQKVSVSSALQILVPIIHDVQGLYFQYRVILVLKMINRPIIAHWKVNSFFLWIKSINYCLTLFVMVTWFACETCRVIYAERKRKFSSLCRQSIWIGHCGNHRKETTLSRSFGSLYSGYCGPK